MVTGQSKRQWCAIGVYEDEGLAQTARQWLSHGEHCLLEAAGCLRLHSRLVRFLCGLLAVWLTCNICLNTAAAQAAEPLHSETTAEHGLSDAEMAALAGKLTPEERMALLARLSDSQVRELMILQWEQAAVTPTGDDMSMTTRVLGNMQSRGQLIGENLRNTLAQVKNLPAVFPFAIEKLTEGRDKTQLLWIFLAMAMMLTVGIGAEWVFRRATKRVRQQLEQIDVGGFLARFGYLCLRILLDLLAIAVFALATAACFFFMYEGHGPTRDVLITYFAAVIIVRLSSLISRFLLAPAAPALRIIPLDDSNARYVHKCVVGFTVLASFGLLTSALLQILGLDQALHRLLLLMLGLVAVVTLATMIWYSRHGIADVIRGGPKHEAVAGQAQRLFAEIWHLLMIAYVIGIYVSVTIALLAGHNVSIAVWVGSFLIVLAVPLADVAIRHVLTSFFATGGAPQQGPTDAQNRYEPIIRRGLRIGLVLLAIITLARLWGIDMFFMAEGGMGATVTRTMLDIGLTLLIAYVGWGIAKVAIDRRLAPDEDAGAELESGSEVGQGVSRAKTLLPLCRRFLQITIVVIVTMIVLSSLGMNIGPLIAGAGVVGIAIGFGAQTLVRDIVSGMFFLIDDAFRLGEYVDIGSVKGRVEAIHVRSLVLRHHRGPLHTVPFGEIKHLTNYSRDWVIMKLEFRVTYDTDINKVKRIFKKIGAELLAHEDLGPLFIEPFKSQGVSAMEDSAMIVRAKFKAKPGGQFQIRKEAYARVQQAFRENGIKFAHRRVVVDLPPGIEPDTREGKAIADSGAAVAVAHPLDVPARGKGPA